MKNLLMKSSVILSIVLFAAGCTTVSYSAGKGYVGFETDGVKSVQQSKKISFSDDALYSTYDDEFEYDEDGDMIKHIQVQYFEKGDKYDEYVVEYQKIGGTVLPKSVSINGQVYMEVEYEILSSDHEGVIEKFSSSPNIDENLQNLLLFSNQTIHWNIDIDNFDVPFRTDGHFVSTDEKYAFYTGLSLDKVLTVGYDNIVLKRFYNSPAKYRAGYNVSLGNQQKEMEEISDENTRNTLFTFEWDVIGDKIVQKKMTLKETFYDDYQEFFIDRDYDSAGRRVSEEWRVNDSKRKDGEPILLFTQNLTY